MNRIVTPTYDNGLVFNEKGTVTLSSSYSVSDSKAAGSSEVIYGGAFLTPSCIATIPYGMATVRTSSVTSWKQKWVDYGSDACDEPAGFAAEYDVKCTATQDPSEPDNGGNVASSSDPLNTWLGMTEVRRWTIELPFGTEAHWILSISLREHDNWGNAGSTTVNVHLWELV